MFYKKINFTNDKYFLNYNVRPFACIKVNRKEILKDKEDSLIKEFKKYHIATTDSRIIFDLKASASKIEKFLNMNDVANMSLSKYYAFAIKEDGHTILNINICTLLNKNVEELKELIKLEFEKNNIKLKCPILVIKDLGPCFLSNQDLDNFYNIFKDKFDDNALLSLLIANKIGG